MKEVFGGYGSLQPGKAPVTQSRFRPQFTMICPDSSQMVKSGCIGMRGDGKKENQASIRCLTIHDAPTVSPRFVYGSTTTHDDRATNHHGGATDAHDASTIRNGASTIQASRATVPSHPPTNVHDSVVVMRQSWGGGGGGTLIFSSYVGLGPLSTVHPKKKHQEFQAPQREFVILATAKQFPIDV